MPITPRQREQRRKGLGASDMAAVMEWIGGFAPKELSPYQSIGDVFWSKRPDLALMGGQEPDEKQNTSQSFGNLAEKFLIECARLDLAPQKLHANQLRVSPYKIMRSSLDAIIVEGPDKGAPVELKTCQDWTKRGDWGDPGSSDVPLGYLIQVLAQMHCAGAAKGYLFASLSWKGLADVQKYVIHAEPNQAIIDQMIEAANVFWKEYVEMGKVPEGHEVPPDHLIRARPWAKEKAVPLSEAMEAIAAEYIEVSNLARDLAMRKTDMKLAMQHELGDAEFGQTATGYTVRHTVYDTTRIDSDLIKQENPELWERAQKTSPSHRVTVKAPKP